jgi:hypothetical protein
MNGRQVFQEAGTNLEETLVLDAQIHVFRNKFLSTTTLPVFEVS